MNNLIVTIIAIAITAAVAGSAIFYGGQAYQQYQVNAYAAKTIATMNQIKAAVSAWQQDNPGQYFPTKDPVTGTTYTSSNVTAWGDTLTYKGKQYLNLPFYTAYPSFNINYGPHGNLLDWYAAPGVLNSADNVHVFAAYISIQPDTTGNLWIYWFADMGSHVFNYSYTPSDISFYAQLCYAIDQQMGQFPYASNLTTFTYTYSAPNVTIILPQSALYTYTPNICTHPNGNWNYFGFAMPL